MTKTRDRRSLPRMACQFPLRFRMLPATGPGYVEATVEDMSASGVRFRSTDDVRVRSSLLFELLIPGSQPVHTFGRAAWVRERPAHDGFEIGGKFEEQSTASRRALERHLECGQVKVGP